MIPQIAAAATTWITFTSRRIEPIDRDRFRVDGEKIILKMYPRPLPRRTIRRASAA